MGTVWNGGMACGALNGGWCSSGIVWNVWAVWLAELLYDYDALTDGLAGTDELLY